MMLSGCGGGFGVSGCIAAGVDISALSLLAGGASMAAAFPAMSVAALLSASFRLDIRPLPMAVARQRQASARPILQPPHAPA